MNEKYKVDVRNSSGLQIGDNNTQKVYSNSPVNNTQINALINDLEQAIRKTQKLNSEQKTMALDALQTSSNLELPSNRRSEALGFLRDILSGVSESASAITALANLFAP